MSKNFSKYSRPFLAMVISLGALYLRIKNLAGRELWNDEIFQLSQTAGRFKPIWARSTYGDMTCFPGDYLLTYPFVQIFADNKWGLAIPHFVMTVLGFYFLYRICQRHFKTIYGYVIAFSIVCFNQYLVFHSLELRPYGVLATLALMAFYYSDIFVRDSKRLTALKKTLIGVLFIAIIWFHAFGIIIVFSPLLYWMLSQKDRAPLKGIFAVFLIALPVWLWFATANPLHLTKEIYLARGMNTFTYIQNPLDGFWSSFNRIVFYHLIGFKKLYFLLGALVISIFVPFADKAKKFGFFLTVVILPIEIILLADLHTGYWFLLRQYIYLAPLFAFFLAWLWDSSIAYYLDKAQRRFTARSIIGLAFMLICMGAGIVNLLLHAVKSL